jgi:hypothetical protein
MCAVAGLIAAIATPAHASTAVHSRFKGRQAIATYSRVSGCIETDAIVIAQKGLSRNGTGTPTRQTNVRLEVFAFNFCTETDISDAFGTAVISDSAFTIGRSLTSAHLDATVGVTDVVSTESYNVHVTMTWSGTGLTSTTKNHFRSKVGDSTFMETFHGTTRDAQANGSITRGMTTLISGTADFANLGDFTDSTLELTR